MFNFLLMSLLVASVLIHTCGQSFRGQFWLDKTVNHVSYLPLFWEIAKAVQINVGSFPASYLLISNGGALPPPPPESRCYVLHVIPSSRRRRRRARRCTALPGSPINPINCC